MTRVFKTSALVATVALFGATQAGAAVVSHYELGESGTGGVEADSVGSNDMHLEGGTHAVGAAAPGAVGSTGSLDLDGQTWFEVDNYITDGTTGDNYLISAWVNPDGTGANQIILSDGHGGAGVVVFQNGTGFGIGMGGAGGFWNVGSTVITPGTWYFVEVERLAGVMDFRVDGVSQGLADPGIGTLDWAGGASLGNQYSGGFAFDGQLDAVTYEIIPEPGSLALLGLGGLALIRRRR